MIDAISYRMRTAASTTGTARRISGSERAGGSDWRATLVLARREAVLLVRHPLHLAGIVLACLAALLSTHRNVPAHAAYFEVGVAVAALDGMGTFFATHLCATRAARSHATGWLDATATSRASRTAALCLATLAPFAVACLLMAVLDPRVAAWSERSETPGAVRLLSSAICVLGAGLLAVAVSRWLRFVGAPVLTMVALIATSVWLEAHSHLLLEPFTDWGLWLGDNAPDGSLAVLPGSPAWHALYLTGLSALALCAALTADRKWRYPALAAAAVLTVIAGAAQLP